MPEHISYGYGCFDLFFGKGRLEPPSDCMRRDALLLLLGVLLLLKRNKPLLVLLLLLLLPTHKA